MIRVTYLREAPGKPSEISARLGPSRQSASDRNADIPDAHAGSPETFPDRTGLGPDRIPMRPVGGQGHRPRHGISNLSEALPRQQFCLTTELSTMPS